MKAAVLTYATLTLAIGSSAFAGPDGELEDLHSMAKFFDAAILAKDGQTRERQFLDSGTFVDQNDSLLNKKGYVAHYINEVRIWTSSKSMGQVFHQIAEDVVIETGIWEGFDGAPSRERGRYLSAWSRKGDSWSVVAE